MQITKRDAEVPALFVVPSPGAKVDLDALRTYLEANVHVPHRQDADVSCRWCIAISLQNINAPDSEY